MNNNMAESTYENITSSLNAVQINGETDTMSDDKKSQNFQEAWGFPLDELYKIALKFYKEKEGSKAMTLSYKDRLGLIAYTKQVSFGSYRPDASPDVGFLDVVGNDRRQAWQSLGEMSRDEAMQNFVHCLDTLCPLLKPYIQAHQAEKEEQERKRQEEDEKRKKEEEEQERKQLEQQAQQRQQHEKNKYLQQEVQIRTALNQQTAIQFKQYAEQQHPGNAEQQEILIRQLQEQHFQQYMQQVYQQQLLHQQQQYQQLQAMASTEQQPEREGSLTDIQLQTTTAPQAGSQAEQSIIMQSETGPTENGLGGQSLVADGQVDGRPADGGELQEGLQQQDNEEDENGDESELVPKMPPLVPASIWTRKDLRVFKDTVRKNPDNVIKIGSLATATELPPIAAASMWTRKDLKDFKDSLRKDPDSVIKVGSGETVTVRVPTHEDGTCLFWEFATDSYDVGFGVYFEWTISPSNQVSVHVSESSDEEDLEDEEGAGANDASKGDVEKGAGPSKKDNRPPTDEIIPVYRRDCHEEVYCGSHMYPGRGVYLLKFDNSYSLWRSKTLYYRVYYTR